MKCEEPCEASESHRYAGATERGVYWYAVQQAMYGASRASVSGRADGRGDRRPHGGGYGVVCRRASDVRGRAGPTGPGWASRAVRVPTLTPVYGIRV